MLPESANVDVRAVGIAVLEQRKPVEDRRGRDAIESRKHSTLTEDTDIVSGASIALSMLRTVDSVLSIDVSFQIPFRGREGEGRPRRPPFAWGESWYLPSKRDERGTF